jgi:hypothetical protein
MFENDVVQQICSPETDDLSDINYVWRKFMINTGHLMLLRADAVDVYLEFHLLYIFMIWWLFKQRNNFT